MDRGERLLNRGSIPWAEKGLRLVGDREGDRESVRSTTGVKCSGRILEGDFGGIVMSGLWHDRAVSPDEAGALAFHASGPGHHRQHRHVWDHTDHVVSDRWSAWGVC